MNLYRATLRARDRQRREKARAPLVVRGEARPWERNPQGLMRWYLHPAMRRRALSNLTVWVQELPPGGRSGKQRIQGGGVVFIWKGRGRTVIDGVSHAWRAESLLQLPVRPGGIVFQHFNGDKKRAALLVCAEPDHQGLLGVDLGSGFEQLEDAE